ncbi:MAG: hypothetical protein PWQ62_868 [Candidatus Methanomethylophilaceae archaeon]|nr:hypothetical protein [Candidatus Methanomethylophilaceae archaeon]
MDMRGLRWVLAIVKDANMDVLRLLESRHARLMMMRANKLCKERSLKTLMLELSKIRRVELVDGSFVTTEIAKRQREIIDVLELNVERLCA